tara:strand:- start:63 stop:1790 length:1728 start_codon:yes stop_codon:yes gene_type:complete
MKKYLKLLNNNIYIAGLIVILITSLKAHAQNPGNLIGNIQRDYQTFQEDITIGAEEYPRYTSGHLNLIYNYKKITVGGRLELYHNVAPGSGLEQYEGMGVSNKFIQFKHKKIDLTAGNIYDEFGNGLIFKTYFDPNLGVDNSISGFRFKSIPMKGVYITAITGKQRNAWDKQNPDFLKQPGYMQDEEDFAHGLVSAFNADIALNETITKNWESNINIGASFVTKHEVDNDPIYKLPENVGAFNGRMNISKRNTSIQIDYAHKINDPSSDNNFIYQNGNGLIITTNYSRKGLGVSIGAKRIQNMSFRSNRKGQFQDFNINYITPFTKQQSYALATIYPYISQPNGEMGMQLDIYYKIPKKTKIGGQYGVDVNFNFSNSFDIHKTIIDENTSLNQRGSLGYNSDFFKKGAHKLFQEINLEISKKVNRSLKLIGTYIHLINNDKVLVSQPLLENQEHEIIYANIFILESIIKMPKKGSLRPSMRTEIQHLNTKQHFGNWAMGLIECKLSKWFFSFQDMYNYGHPDKPHYYSISSGYSKGSHRISLTYGKQRKGLFCVGGVCRDVPASNGFTLSLTSSF